MKGSSFTTGHEPLERTKQLITLMVKAISPKVCPEICRKHREWRKKKKKAQESVKWASAKRNKVILKVLAELLLFYNIHHIFSYF